MKIKRNGKEYDYEYKLVMLNGRHYKRLKDLSDKEKMPMGKLIMKLIDLYEGNIRQ